MRSAAPTSPAAPDQRTTRPVRRLIPLLVGLVMVTPMATDAYLPGLPSLAADLGTTDAGAQLTLTTFMVGTAVGQVLAGPISDGTGRRPLLVLGTCLFAAAGVLTALSPSTGLLLAARALQGLGGACGMVLARAVVLDVTSGADTARVIGTMMAIVGLAPALAPVLGGLLVDVVGWRGVLGLVAVVGIGLAAVVWARVPETLPPERRTPAGLGAVARNAGIVLGRTVYRRYLFTHVLTFTAMFTYVSSSSLVLQDDLGLSARQYSLVFGSNALGMTLFAFGSVQLFTRTRVGHRLLAGTGLALSLTGATALLALGLADAPLPALLVALWCAVAPTSMAMSNVAVLAAEQIRDYAGSGSAWQGSLPFLAGAAIAPVLGALHATAPVPMAAVMVTLLVCAVVMLTLARRAEAALKAPAGARVEPGTSAAD
ncbi:multidrug effflux MFS transporter [Nocardioides sp. GY 10127]|uniref:multidrug effflux MFS transporter n=1 Tax=Nocardioides sp. GY 10127 TaxID=2569762 RepID=UPI0010A7564E|nr:multidrug effflux MFS transporter [Nocardioides sp. GY 10127]TIC79975.1 multidrug effflux MFS transporter [Nocardioides sp. GY 10127]